MNTRSFLRKEMKREATVIFRLSRRDFDEFLKVVHEIGEREGYPLHGRRTAAFLFLVRRALRDAHREKEMASWSEREAAFVQLTRSQEETIMNLRSQIEEERSFGASRIRTMSKLTIRQFAELNRKKP